VEVVVARVRAVLALHLERDHPGSHALPPAEAQADGPTVPDPQTHAPTRLHRGADPNTLIPAQYLRASLVELQQREGAEALRKEAAAYVQLWARTFKGLVRQLRGRPERALSLFASEVYPYLRGDRLAARVEDVRPGEARLVLATDLPDAYLEGLVASFVALSGAEVESRMEGTTCRVQWHVGGVDRIVRAAQLLAALRIPLVVAALLSVCTGILLSWRVGHPVQWVRSGLILLGALAAQAAANAWHDLQSPHPAGPLGPVRPSARLMNATVRGGYVLAGGIGFYLAWGHLWVLAFAVAGLVVSALFGKFRNHGLGPLLAGITYGPLLPLGVLVALGPLHARDLALLGYTLPLGLLAAATLYVDDLADRPLDEAGGQRTLIVRLAPKNRLVGFAVLAVGALASLVGAMPSLLGRDLLLGTTLAAVVILLVVQVGQNLDDPRRLAPARFGTFILLLATAILAMDAIGGFP
jgi:1,4-dihydroxy-2-naphthoate octaprenyltransferase